MIKYYTKFPILIKAINFINISNNESNHLPYHSIDHLFEVFKLCSSILESPEFINDTTLPKLELLIACLFHDYGHSGGKSSDDINITYAIDGIRLFHSAYPDFDLNQVVYLIQCTEYPYKVKDEDLSIAGKIMRDCDMCYVFQSVSIVKLYSGLRKEFDNSYSDFLKNQKQFLSNIKFNTEFCNTLWLERNIREERLAELDLLIKYV